MKPHAISGLPMTLQKYEKAIQILKERFGRKQILMNAHMESLYNISAPSTNKSIAKFYDNCESNIRALENLGVQTHSYGSLLNLIVLKKLTEQIRSTIFRAHPAADCSLNDLRTALRQELETREKGHLISEHDDTLIETDDFLAPAAYALFTNTLQHKRQ